MEASAQGDAPKLEEAKSAWQRQCSTWVQQKGQDTASEKRKPPVYRKASYELLAALENGLVQSCRPGASLTSYILPLAIEDRPPDSLQWQRLMFAGDCGPDNSASLAFLLRQLNCDIDFYPDDSHGCNNDMEGVLKSCNMWQWCLLMLSSFNCWLSPFWECMRFQQVKDAIEGTLMVM